MAQTQPKKMNWWYQSIIEWMISNPEGSLGDCANFFNVTQSWLSVIINSDAFKARHAECSADHFHAVSAGVADRMTGLAVLSADVLAERIERERDNIGLGIVRETAEMALKSLGFVASHGRASQQISAVNVNVGVQVDRATLASAREKMRLVNEASVPAEPPVPLDRNTLAPIEPSPLPVEVTSTQPHEPEDKDALASRPLEPVSAAE